MNKIAGTNYSTEPDIHEMEYYNDFTVTVKE